jgi:3-oxoadipate CoA-transferase alpha subunit
VQAEQLADLGVLDPECIVTPGIFVKRVVNISNPAQESKLVAENRRYPW